MGRQYELVIDALQYGYHVQQDTYPVTNLATLPPIQASKKTVRRLNPSYFNAFAMTLMGNFMAEAERVPEPMEHVFRQLLRCLPAHWQRQHGTR